MHMAQRSYDNLSGQQVYMQKEQFMMEGLPIQIDRGVNYEFFFIMDQVSLTNEQIVWFSSHLHMTDKIISHDGGSKASVTEL